MEKVNYKNLLNKFKGEKKMKFKKGLKIIALVSAMTVICGTFFGCGKDESISSDGRVIITVGNWPTKEGRAKELENAKKARFEEANPEFEIVPDEWTFDLKSFYPKAAGGKLPIIFNTAYTEASQIMAAGYSADITDELKKQDVYDKINPNILDIISKDGRVYMYPTTAYVLGMGCNIDLMKEAGLVMADGTPMQPKTWDEVAEFAVKIKKATGKAGLVLPTMANHGGWLFTPIAWSYGVEFMKKGDDGKWKATFDTQEATDALQYIKDLKWKYDVLPANTLIDGTVHSEIYGSGNAGLFIVAGNYSSSAAKYGMKPEQMGIMAMPAGPKKHVTLLGGGIFSVSNKATDKQVEGAVKWAKTVFSPETTEESRANAENTAKLNVEQGLWVGVNTFSSWKPDCDSAKSARELNEKYSNTNPNHYKLYNDFLDNLGDCELRAEEPVCAQELYGILDNCIQEVLTNKDADCAALLEKACSDFQKNYLDNLDY